MLSISSKQQLYEFCRANPDSVFDCILNVGGVYQVTQMFTTDAENSLGILLTMFLD